MKKFWQQLDVIWKRIVAETPIFFRRIIAISLSASAGAVAVLASSYKVSPHFHTILENIAVAGVVAAAISKTTKVDPPNPAP